MAERGYDPKKVTVQEAAVIDAITESMDEPDAITEARALIASLKESGFILVRDPNRPRTPYRSNLSERTSSRSEQSDEPEGAS